MLPSLNSMVSRLRLKHFRLLVALDDCGSLLKAAEYVALSQPGATKALQEIESALGAELFIRNNRGLEPRSEEHTSELQSLMRISYAVFCLKKKKKKKKQQ